MSAFFGSATGAAGGPAGASGSATVPMGMVAADGAGEVITAGWPAARLAIVGAAAGAGAMIGISGVAGTWWRTG